MLIQVGQARRSGGGQPDEITETMFISVIDDQERTVLLLIIDPENAPEGQLLVQASRPEEGEHSLQLHGSEPGAIWFTIGLPGQDPEGEPGEVVRPDWDELRSRKSGD
jgi:hypothetical protein